MVLATGINNNDYRFVRDLLDHLMNFPGPFIRTARVYQDDTFGRNHKTKSSIIAIIFW